MSTRQTHEADHEPLSALFDGQLQGDAARFALQRLGHDARWRQRCGRWQLAGDALRGECVAPAPQGFADRVMAAVALEDSGQVMPAGVVAARVAGRRHPRWIGGAALAASVALAALFVARPVFQAEDGARDVAVGQELTSAATTAATTDPMPLALTDAAPADIVDAGSDAAAGLAVAAAVAATARPRRNAERRARQVSRESAETSRTPAREAVAAVAAAVEPARSAVDPDTGEGVHVGRPFLPADAIVSRPWPRAVLPSFPAHSALTAGFQSSDRHGDTVSFYPFEPDVLQDESLHLLPGQAPESAEPAAVHH